MANAKSKTEQKPQDDVKVEATTQEPTVPEAPAKGTQAQPKAGAKKDKDEKPKSVSFQDLDEPNENLPGVVAPKKEN